MGRQVLDPALQPGELLRRCAGAPGAVVLDGAGDRTWCGRHAWFGLAPAAVLRVDADGTATRRDAAGTHPLQGDPLDLLAQFVAAQHPGAAADDAFVVAALGYDLRRAIEPGRGARRPPPRQPLLHAAAYDWLLAYDRAQGSWEIRIRPGADADPAAVTAFVRRRAARVLPAPAAPAGGALLPAFTAAEHERAVRRALDYIAAGDIYQVNLAQRFVADRVDDAAGLFAALQRRHAMPFAAYLDAGDFTLVSNSPECFLWRDGDRIATFPIKGTRPRGAGDEADARLRADLVADPKERAEHVMIIDLERNDLGRICRSGTVAVPERLRVETFPSLHHLVSAVTGELRPEVDLAAILRATFPGGSITGAPKIRAMEIIDELEAEPRGFYTGAIGLLGPRQARLNIAIRTATIRDGRLEYFAGGGIVADSEPRREYEEILVKAQAFARALGQPATASAA